MCCAVFSLQIYIGAEREQQIDMAKPWRSLVRVEPQQKSPNNLAGRTGGGITSSGVSAGVSVATLS